MAATDKLIEIQEKNNSYICLGLDLDPKRMPAETIKSIKSMYEFTMNIIDATKDHVCAYKPNMAFFENLGHDGISLLESIVNRMPTDIPIILDGKRGDIGNTASFYAEAMYERFRADWVTLSPYMGYDSMRPFLEYNDKGIFVLCLTSNAGSKDFQLLDINGKPLYQIVAEKVEYWNKEDNCGLVIGATNPEQLKELRVIAKNMPLLIPGVGAQGGSLEKAVLYGTDNFSKMAIINVSRSVLFASNGDDYAERAQQELIKLNQTVKKIKSGEYTETEQTQEAAKTEESAQPIEQQEYNSQQISEEPKKQFTGFTPPVEQKQPEEPKIEDPQPEEPKREDPEHDDPKREDPKPEQHSQPQQTEVQPLHAQHTPEPVKEEPQQHSQPQHTEKKPEIKEEPTEESTEEKPERQEEEPKKTPPPLPTPPEPIRPDPEIIRRNREEYERKQREQQQRQQNQQNDSSGNQQNNNDRNDQRKDFQNNQGNNRSFNQRHNKKFNKHRNNNQQNNNRSWDKKN